MYNLIEYSDNYSKSSGSLWHYYKDIQAVNSNGNIVDFNKANVNDSFNFQEEIKDQTDDVEIMVPLKYLSSLWRTLDMPLIYCEINLILTLSASRVIFSTNVEDQGATFSMTGTKLYVPLLTLSTQYNTKLIQQLKSGLQITTNWNKYQWKPDLLQQHRYLNHLIDPRFQGVNRLFVLSLKNYAQGTSNKEYFLPNVKIKDCNVMIDRKCSSG